MTGQPGEDASEAQARADRVILALPSLLFAAGPASAVASEGAASPGICVSSSHPALAARIGQGVAAARRDRVSFVAVEVDDPGAGVVCRLDSTSHFDSASVVKVTILGALLHKAQAKHRPLTRRERALAAMPSSMWCGVARKR